MRRKDQVSRRAAAATLSLWLLAAACGGRVVSVAPPKQWAPEAETCGLALMSVDVSTPRAAQHVLDGVLGGDPGTAWRWVNKKSNFRFFLPETRNLVFKMRILVVDQTFNETGPFHLTLSVDAKRFARVRIGKAGEHQIEVPVGPELLRTSQPVTVTAEVDRVYLAPADGVDLAFLLKTLGFEAR